MPNHLKDQSSAYLLDHADNPVDWYPWCEEAFARARQEDKPVFLSIGYASCHWCHVMARESFENEAVAALLNRDYIAVKVDREERRDVDAVYMELCVALNGSGGWPLTAILTPEGKPFFVGTYLPRESRGGRMGLIPLLQAVAAKWARDREKLIKTADDLVDLIGSEPQPQSADSDGKVWLDAALEQLRGAYDAEYGGFGTAPKFPTPQNLLLLLRASRLGGDASLRRMAEHTLQQMARGGIYDHIGGGFSRYSTDREWLAPHFEKTLYDNALLAYVYTEAWQEGRFGLYRKVAEDTLDYCLRELRAPCGGYCSGQDADSEGVEGKYYLFTPEEIAEVLGRDEGRHFCECYDITPEGNIHGKSIPNLLLNQRWQLIPPGYEDHRERLRLYRAERCALRTDGKLPVGWNGLMLMALSKAAAVFGDPRYAQAARELKDWLLREAGGAEPRALRAVLYPDAPSVGRAQLDDYAFLVLGLLEHYAVDYDPACLTAAAALAEELPARFADPAGGFFLTADDSEALIKRPKESFDGALPSGNSAAAVVFDRLFRLTGEPVWQTRLDRQLEWLSARCGRYPAGAPFGLLALLGSVYPTRELVVVAEEAPAGMRAALARYAPELSVLLKRPGDEALAAAAPFTAALTQIDGKPTYYLCQDGSCSLPFTQDE